MFNSSDDDFRHHSYFSACASWQIVSIDFNYSIEFVRYHNRDGYLTYYMFSMDLLHIKYSIVI